MSLLRRLTRGLQLPEHYFVKLARSASHRYKTYQIPKRSNGFRTIHHPAKELKGVQRWLLRHVLEDMPVHEAAMAYRTGYNIRTNALAHADSRYLLRLDFEDFFPSLLEQDVEAVIRRHFDRWSDRDVEVFVGLVCRWGCLTIGAPTSPSLSNVICRELDGRITAEVLPEGVTYTRYADDMFFSTKRRDVLWDIPEIVEGLLEAVPVPHDVRINEDKTRHSSKRGKRQVTGLVITPRGEVTIGRDRKRKIRAMVHQYGSLSDSERRELAGLLAFAHGVEPDFINALILKYGKPAVDEARAME